MTINRSAAEPSSATTSPGLYCTISMREASHVRSSSERSEKIGIAWSWRGRSAIDNSMSNLCQVIVHELDRDRAFANTGSHAFYGPMTNVSHGKNAGDAGLEQEGFPVR